MSTVHFPKPPLFHTTQKLWFWPLIRTTSYNSFEEWSFSHKVFFKITSFTLKWPYMASSDNNPKRLKILQNHFKVSLQLKKHQNDIFRKKFQNLPETKIFFNFLLLFYHSFVFFHLFFPFLTQNLAWNDYFSGKRLKIPFSKTWKNLKKPKQCKNGLKLPEMTWTTWNDLKRLQTI